MKLFPGMTAYVDIPVASAHDVVKVPNGALRYKPSLPADEVARLYQQNGISAGSGGRGQQNGGSAEGAQRWRERQQQQQSAQSAESPGGGAAPKPEMREPASDVAVVWKLLPDKSIAPVQLRTGITDHTYSELVKVLAGKLEPGEQLVIGSGDVARSQPRMGPGMGIGGGPRTR
jgi:HlyD family secretion protein